jgi:ABC-type Fe3+/spermidine/putrescine transport system ATPase subunit
MAATTAGEGSVSTPASTSGPARPDDELKQSPARGQDDRTSGSAALELRALSKRFGSVQAVRDVDLTIKRGEFWSLLGPSGSGKTTILRIVAGFEQPTSGRVLIDGVDVAGMPPGKRGVGLVFQHYALFPHMTVRQNIGYPLKLRRVNRTEREQRVSEILELIGLSSTGERRPHELSGGQQQRVALGRALAFQPAFLLMDEPLGALDRALRVNMQDEIKRIHLETGVTIVYVTHDREEALGMSDRIAIMRDAQLLQSGRPQDVFERPDDAFVADLLGEANLLLLSDARPADGGRVRARLLDWDLLIRGSVGDSSSDARALLRPWSLKLSSPGDELVLHGVVVDSRYAGERTSVTLHVDGIGRLRAHLPAGPPLRVDDPIALSFTAEDLVCLPR